MSLGLEMRPQISTHTSKYAHAHTHQTNMHRNTPRHTFKQRQQGYLHNLHLISCSCPIGLCVTMINYPKYTTRLLNCGTNCPIRKLFSLRFMIPLQPVDFFLVYCGKQHQQQVSEEHPFINHKILPANRPYCALMKILRAKSY